MPPGRIKYFSIRRYQYLNYFLLFGVETEMNKDDWATKLTTELLRHQRIYVNVINVKATRNVTKGGQQLLGDSGLVVSRLMTRDDLTIFAKVSYKNNNIM